MCLARNIPHGHDDGRILVMMHTDAYASCEGGLQPTLCVGWKRVDDVVEPHIVGMPEQQSA